MGELAALGAALCWSIAPVCFTLAGRKLDGSTLNRLRLLLSCCLLFCAHLLIIGWPSLQTMDTQALGWLALSGVIGLALGDTCMFRAFLLIGPRLVMLVMTLVPLFSALLAWLFFAEAFTLIELLGAIVCLSGVVFVISARRKGNPNNGKHDGKDNGNLRKGLWLSLLAAAGQSLGLICAKQGLSAELPVLSAVLTRMVAATICILLIQGFHSKLSLKGLDKHGALLIISGTILGPFIGMWLSIIAIEQTRVGLAATLMATTPILILPLSYWVLKEHIGPRAIAGSVVALLGAMVILL